MSKKLIALFLAFALVFSTITVAFAEEAIGTDAAATVTLGMLKGEGNGVTADYLSTTPTRLQAAIMYLRLKGLEDEALAWTGTDNFPDGMNYAWEGGKNIMAYLKAHPELGWIGADGMFLPSNQMNTQAYYKVMLEALGYKQNTAEVIGDFTWGGVFQYAAQVGLVKIADVANFTVNDLAIGTIEALSKPVKGSETTLISSLVEAGKVTAEAAIATGIYQDPADAALIAAIADAEAAIIALPAEIALTDKADVEAARELVDAAMLLNTEAVIAGIDTLVAAEATIVELEAAAAELMVESVTALNLVEIEIMFNAKLDVDSAETANNYTIDSHEVETATVKSDGKTVLLTLDVDGAPATAVKLAQQEELTVVIDGVKNMALSSTMEEYETNEITAFDATIPVAQSIELTGPNKFVITFSEPIDSAVNGTVEINDGIYGVTSAPADDTNEVIVTLSASTLTEGTYNVEISGYKDFAGYAILQKDFTLDYTKTTTAPVATVKSADQTEVVIQFDRTVTDEDGADLDKDYFYHTFTSYKPVSATPNADKTEFTLDFSNYPLPEGSVKIVVDYNANDKDIEDEWGNKMTANTEFAVNITADKTNPEITKLEVEDEDEIIVYFNEALVQATAEDKDNYTVKDSDGEEVAINTLAYSVTSDDEYIVTMTFNDDLSGNHTVEISNITDKALEANTITTVTKAFTVTDQTGITLSSTTAVTIEGSGSDSDFIIVTFPESMTTTGQYSILSKDNYLLSSDAGTSFAQLDSSDTIALFGNGAKKVKITLKDNSDYAVDHADFRLAVARVADATGNTSTMLSYTVDPTADSAPAASSFIAIDEKTVEVTFEGVLTTVVANAFSTTKAAATGTAAAISYKVEDVDNDDLDETVVTITLKAEQQLADSNATGILAMDIVASLLKSETGKFVGADLANAVVDGIAPNLVSLDQTAADTYELTFDENVSVTNLNLAATDLVITDEDNDILVAGLDYNVTEGAGAADDTTLYIVLAGDYAGYEGDLTIETKSTVTYIFDTDGENAKINIIEDEEIATDATAPTVTSITMTDAGTADTLEVGDTIVVVYNEAIDPATLGMTAAPTAGGSAVAENAADNLITFVDDDANGDHMTIKGLANISLTAVTAAGSDDWLFSVTVSADGKTVTYALTTAGSADAAGTLTDAVDTTNAGISSATVKDLAGIAPADLADIDTIVVDSSSL